MHRLLAVTVALTGVVLLVGWWLTIPDPLTGADLPDHRPDAVAGERVFWAGGCASCHARPVDGKRAKGEDKLVLGGGLELDTPYGMFRVPNISPHPDDGIGGWSMAEFVSAMQRGVSPDGRHYYPSFPYASYAKMQTADVMDLKAYIDTLEAVAGGPQTHEIDFPWNFRRGVGLWKRRYLDAGPVINPDSGDAAVARGREIVEGAGHCGECHTPRDGFGGLVTSRWLGGAPNPEGRGRVPNITPAGEEISGWSAADISYYLESGFTPEFDTVGGSMVAVQESMAKLPKGDLDAVAAYLKAVPAVEETQ